MNNEHILCRAFNNMKRTSDFLLHRGAQSTAIGQFGLQLNIIAARYRFKYYQDFNQLLIPCESFDSSASSFNIYVMGYAALCIWGISPTIFVSLPQQNCFISPTTWVTSPTTCVTSPTHFLISPTTLCHFAPRQKILFCFFKFYLFFISQHPCIILTKAKPFLRI